MDFTNNATYEDNYEKISRQSRSEQIKVNKIFKDKNLKKKQLKQPSILKQHIIIIVTCKLILH